MRSLFLLVVLIVAAAAGSAGAVERLEEPLTFRHAMDWRSSSALAFDPVDKKKIDAEDEAAAERNMPPRVAVVRKETSDREFEQYGQWSVIDDMSVWRLRVSSADASWLSFAFDNVFLPPGTSLFVYNDSQQQVLGPYTDQHNTSSGQLWTPMVAGDVAYVEINVPTMLRRYLTFDLNSVNHGYRKMTASKSQKAGACNIDVVCPQGDGWRDQIRSVARYIFERDGGLLTCTGSLVNTTSGDRRPFFLTANHCIGTASEARSMVLFWNYENSVCGGSPDGSSSQAQSGATLLATLGRLDGPLPERDMTLVELDSAPGASFNVYYSGWDSNPDIPVSGVSIHHPDGSEKSISTESGPITKTGYLTSVEDPDGTHLRIAAWDEGTTEQGSSGAGFWNTERRLVGVLSGGAAACDNPDGSDYYAHLASHYDVGTSSATRFKAWLDPLDTGATQVDGIEGCDVPAVGIAINPNPAEVNQRVMFTAVIPAGSADGLSFAWDFDDNGTLDSSLPSASFTYASTYVGNVTLMVSTPTCTAPVTAAMVVVPEGGNSDPIAAAAFTANAANEGSNVQVSGAGSSDPDGDALTYEWAQTSGPAVLLSSTTAVAPSFTLPMVTTDTEVMLELTVTDIFGATDAEQASITVLNVNRVPVAIVSQSTISASEGSLVTLNAAVSSDPDGDSLTFSWVQTVGEAITLNNSNASVATFTAPPVSAPATLAFVVTVSDQSGLSASTTVTVNVNNVEPPSSGGGGALGWPVIVVLFLLAGIRSNRRPLVNAFLLSGLLMLSACGTADTNPVTPQTVEPVSQSVTENVIVLVKRDTRESIARISDADNVANMVSALHSRERRYEKIKPYYEYEIQLIVDGKTEVWQVSQSGYIQKNDSPELYRMDMSTLKNYMK